MHKAFGRPNEQQTSGVGPPWLLAACVAAGILVGGLAPAAHAQTAESLNRRGARAITLGEAIAVAVRKNPGLAQTRIDERIAQTDALEAAGFDDWVFTANGTWLSQRVGRIQNSPFQVTSNDSLIAASSLTRALRTGGTIGIHADAGYTRQGFSFTDPVSGTTVTQIATAYNIGLTAAFNQPLLRGRGERIARASERRAGIGVDRSSVARRSTAIDMIAKIVKAYWELAYAERELAIRRAAVDLAKKQLVITKAARQVGSKSASDVRAIEHGIAVREQAVLQARVNLSNRSLALRQLSGLEIGPGQIDLLATTRLAYVPRRFDLDKALEEARAQNPALALLRSRLKDAAMDVELAKDATRASLDVSARFGPTGTSDQLSEMLNQFVTFDSFTATTTLSYNQRLGNRSAKALYQRAKLVKRRLELDLADAQRNTSVQIVQAINLVRLSRKRIEVAEKAIKLAEQNLLDEKVRFDANEATNFDVLQRQNEIQKAHLDKARAIADYLEALATVDALTGDLLRRYGVKLL